MFATDCVLYAFLNRSADQIEIWYIDRLDFGYRLHFVAKKANNRWSDPGKFSNMDFEIIIIFWLLIVTIDFIW